MTHVRLTAQAARNFKLDVDFPIESGVTALYGPAGAGKTFLLNSITGFTRPHAGRILLDDAILFDGAAHVHVPPRLRRIGFLSQSDSLFPHMTVRQNLAFPAMRWARLERHRRVQEMMDRFQIADAAKLWPKDLDPQHKLRCAAARALIAEPKLLLLDDCGADEALLIQIRDAAGIPILFASTNLDLCCAVADRLLLLAGGRILQSGAPNAVLDQPGSVETARLLGIENLFQATIVALDPGRNSSRLECEHFTLTGPYLPGHFKGNRIWLAASAQSLRVHSGDIAAPPNSVEVELVRASLRAHQVMLEFSFGILAAVSHDQFARQRDNKGWQVEFPPDALRIL
jgi:molybdate transport system ATP-binding protein